MIVDPRDPVLDAEGAYAVLLGRARVLIVQDVTTRFTLAGFVGLMLDLDGVDERRVADDVGVTPAGLRRLLRVYRFWGTTRIAATGHLRASWWLYDRVALDPLTTPEDKERLLGLADQGVDVVRRELRRARDRVVRHLDSVAGDVDAVDPALMRGFSVNAVVIALETARERLDDLEAPTSAELTLISAALSPVIARFVDLQDGSFPRWEDVER